MDTLSGNACYPYGDAWTPGYPTPEYISGYEMSSEGCVGSGGISLPVLTSISMAEMGKQCMSQWYQYNQDDLMHSDSIRRDAYMYQHQTYQHHRYGSHHHVIHSTTIARRNERERNRVKNINSTFANLRQHLPCSSKNKKLSKVQILRSAIQYINQLQHVLDAQDHEQSDNPGQLRDVKLEPQHEATSPEVSSSSSGDSLRAFDTESVTSDCDIPDTDNRTSSLSPTSLISESSSHLSPSIVDDGDHDDLMDQLSDWIK